MQTPTTENDNANASRTDKAVVCDALILPFYRVILTRMDDARWYVISNPRWDHCTKAQSDILLNFANDYAEHKNCGVIYRMIRAENWAEYCDGPLNPAWALDPQQNVPDEPRDQK